MYYLWITSAVKSLNQSLGLFQDRQGDNPTMDEANQNKPSQDLDSNAALHLHLAEYQMLMARLTNWITLQNSLYAVLIFFLALISGIWGSFRQHAILLWGVAFVVQLIAIF